MPKIRGSMLGEAFWRRGPLEKYTYFLLMKIAFFPKKRNFDLSKLYQEFEVFLWCGGKIPNQDEDTFYPREPSEIMRYGIWPCLGERGLGYKEHELKVEEVGATRVSDPLRHVLKRSQSMDKQRLRNSLFMERGNYMFVWDIFGYDDECVDERGRTIEDDPHLKEDGEEGMWTTFQSHYTEPAFVAQQYVAEMKLFHNRNRREDLPVLLKDPEDEEKTIYKFFVEKDEDGYYIAREAKENHEKITNANVEEEEAWKLL